VFGFHSVCTSRKQAFMRAKEKGLVQERVEHSDAHMWLQLKHSLSLRRRQSEAWPVVVGVPDTLHMIVKGRHRERLGRFCWSGRRCNAAERRRSLSAALAIPPASEWSVVACRASTTIRCRRAVGLVVCVFHSLTISHVSRAAIPSLRRTRAASG